VPRALAAATAALVLFLPAGAASAQPPPDERIPADPAQLAQRLAEVIDETNVATDAWLATAPTADPPEAIVLGALYQQRAYRFLARRTRLTRTTLAALPVRLRPAARDQVAALRGLFRLSGPPQPRRRLKVGRALAPATLRGFYDDAERRFGVPWHVLAAVNLVETNFNRVRSTSTAGALGPMQFLPSTWRAYGLGGDVRDPHDAILGAANYLRASGAPRNLRRALFAYNHSTLYVDAVLSFAGRMRKSERNYVTLWSWQVFQRTPDGERRLTGPAAP
jgi:membrane-bound lytic murein transglycosylase B